MPTHFIERNPQYRRHVFQITPGAGRAFVIELKIIHPAAAHPDHLAILPAQVEQCKIGQPGLPKRANRMRLQFGNNLRADNVQRVTPIAGHCQYRRRPRNQRVKIDGKPIGGMHAALFIKMSGFHHFLLCNRSPVKYDDLDGPTAEVHPAIQPASLTSTFR